jgi:cytochrome P450
MTAGAITSTSWLQFLVLIMAAYPDVQKKAHEEIDRVVGPNHSPTLDDLQRLPYVEAIIKEV